MKTRVPTNALAECRSSSICAPFSSAGGMESSRRQHHHLRGVRLFRRESVMDAGGYLHDTSRGQELVLRLKDVRTSRVDRENRIRARSGRVDRGPGSLKVLGRQRDRWHRGLADVLWRHRRMLLNPRYGVTGLVVFPYYAFVELLAPVIEAAGLVTLTLGLIFGIIDWNFAALFYFTAYGLGTALTAFTLILEDLSFHRYETFRDRTLLFWWALLENSAIGS